MNQTKQPKTLTLNDYQEFCKTTAIYPNVQLDGQDVMVPVYPAMLLASEAGEVLGKLQKCLRDKKGVLDSKDIEGVMYELGDTLWAAAAICSDLGLKLQEVMEWNKRKLEDRKSRGTLGGRGDHR